jgi:hypothetical protein
VTAPAETGERCPACHSVITRTDVLACATCGCPLAAWQRAMAPALAKVYAAAARDRERERRAWAWSAA